MEYRELVGFSRYIFCSDGNIIAKQWKGSNKRVVMSPAYNSNGYLRTVLIDDDGNKHPIMMHRMIAKAFVGNPYNKKEVNHINGIKDDNRPCNLEWVTHQENIRHSFDTNLQNNIGENNPISKLTDSDVREIRAKFKPRKYTREMLAKEYGVLPSTIKDVVLRKSWKHVN